MLALFLTMLVPAFAQFNDDTWTFNDGSGNANNTLFRYMDDYSYQIHYQYGATILTPTSSFTVKNYEGSNPFGKWLNTYVLEEERIKYYNWIYHTYIYDNQIYFNTWYLMTPNLEYTPYNCLNNFRDRYSNKSISVVICVHYKCNKEVDKVWIKFINDPTTGVNTINADTQEAVYYNLQGIKVDNPTNGIFIKKVGNKSIKIKL